MIIAIRSYNIAASKVTSIAYSEGKVLIFVQGYKEPFAFEDMAGDLYSAAMKTWREYLEQRRNDFRSAIEYGIVLASERGNV